MTTTQTTSKRTNYKRRAKRDVYQDVTNCIIKMIEGGLNDGWKRPWVTTGTSGLPTSIAGRQYRGINVLILMGRVAEQGYTSGLWGTYRAWQEVGAQVNGGERGTVVTFYKKLTFKERDDTGEETTRDVMMIKSFCVFAAEQVSGFDLAAHTKRQAERMPDMARRIENVDAMVSAYREAHKITLRHGGDRAFYAPSREIIQMPILESFATTEGYYGTLLHEAAHSTGHPKRLDRTFGKRFGDEAYAVEELVAELASAMLCGALGLSNQPREDHAKYVQSWLKVLRSDKRAIFHAASKAQAAADLLREFEVEMVEEIVTAIAA